MQISLSGTVHYIEALLQNVQNLTFNYLLNRLKFNIKYIKQIILEYLLIKIRKKHY